MLRLLQLCRNISLPVLVLLISLAGAYWLTSENPNQLLRDARLLAAAEPQRAEHLLEQCLAIRPDFPEAQFLRCQLLGRLGYWQEARGLFSLIRNPQELPGEELLAFAQQSFSVGQTELAVQLLEAARKQGPTLIAATQLLVRSCMEHSQFDRAFELCRELTSLSPADPVPYEVIGAYYRDNGEPYKAAEALRQALALHSNAREQNKVRITLAGILLSLGDTVGTRDALMPLVDSSLSSQKDEVLVLEANLLRAEGRAADAIEVIQTCLKEAPNSVSAILTRGLLWFDLGQMEAAQADLETVVRREPHRKEAHFKLSQVYQRLGYAAKAAEEQASSQRLTDAALELEDLKANLQKNPADERLRARVRELTRLTLGRAAP